MSTEPRSASLLARPAPGRFRIGGKLVDKATQKRIEALVEESKRLKSVADDAIKECEEAKDCLRKIRDELNKKNGAISAMAERLAEDIALSTRTSSEAASSLRVELNARNEELLALKDHLSRSTEALEFERTERAEAIRQASTLAALSFRNELKDKSDEVLALKDQLSRTQEELELERKHRAEATGGRGVEESILELQGRLKTALDENRRMEEQRHTAEENYALALLLAAERHTSAHSAAGMRRIANNDIAGFVPLQGMIIVAAFIVEFSVSF